MKKKLLMLTLLGLLAFPFNALCIPPWHVGLEIQFGRTTDCTSRGICHIVLTGGGGELVHPGTLINDNGKISITIDAASLDAATKKLQFGGKKFTLEEDFTIPADVAKQAHINPRLCLLKKGDYVFKLIGKEYVIYITKPVVVVKKEAATKVQVKQ